MLLSTTWIMSLITLFWYISLWTSFRLMPFLQAPLGRLVNKALDTLQTTTEMYPKELEKLHKDTGKLKVQVAELEQYKAKWPFIKKTILVEVWNLNYLPSFGKTELQSSEVLRNKVLTHPILGIVAKWSRTAWKKKKNLNDNFIKWSDCPFTFCWRLRRKNNAMTPREWTV